MAIVPAARPNITRAECMKILAAKGVSAPAIIGIRGYYERSMGDPAGNDRGIYDDCIAIVGVADADFRTFNGNTDPSVTSKGVAVLKPGVWLYKKGKHKINSPSAYDAFRQAADVTVIRDLKGADTGQFGINIHRGSRNSTSSLGCQTVWPEQWSEFKQFGYTVMDRAKAKTIPYVLVTEGDRRVIAKAAGK